MCWSKDFSLCLKIKKFNIFACVHTVMPFVVNYLLMPSLSKACFICISFRQHHFYLNCFLVFIQKTGGVS